jgi:catechol 2,3-dioxygenase-like lactoylglutathione lyase family enzyme
MAGEHRRPHATQEEDAMDWTLELVMVPVTDVDRAKAFYTEQLGFRVDHDTALAGERLVQLTPPGSACSIAIGTVRPSTGSVDMPPGAIQHLQLVVSDLLAAHAELVERGVDASDIQVYDDGSLRIWRREDRLDNVGFVFFSDPDGNGWVVQQISSRGR